MAKLNMLSDVTKNNNINKVVSFKGSTLTAEI